MALMVVVTPLMTMGVPGTKLFGSPARDRCGHGAVRGIEDLGRAQGVLQGHIEIGEEVGAFRIRRGRRQLRGGGTFFTITCWMVELPQESVMRNQSLSVSAMVKGITKLEVVGSHWRHWVSLVYAYSLMPTLSVNVPASFFALAVDGIGQGHDGEGDVLFGTAGAGLLGMV